MLKPSRIAVNLLAVTEVSSEKQYRHGRKQKSELFFHQKEHSDARPFTCEVGGCGKNFKLKSALVFHQNVHSNARTSERKKVTNERIEAFNER